MDMKCCNCGYEFKHDYETENDKQVGDVIVPVGSTEQYCVNYSPTGRCFYGLGTGNKILKQKKFSQCENVGIAIFNEDVKEIFK